MDNPENDISTEDLRAALTELGTYIDITEEDLKKIFAIALRHARERLLKKVPVRDVMTRNVVAVGSDLELDAVAELLSKNKVSGLPVVDGANHVIGIITEADILAMGCKEKKHTFADVLKSILGEAPPAYRHGSKVIAIMTSPATTIRPDEDTREAARILNEKKIKRLPVVDDEGRLIGIISRADIVGMMGKK
ncbi:MAG: CBS domain-containing protein [Dissulfurispiraceae bacterium]